MSDAEETTTAATVDMASSMTTATNYLQTRKGMVMAGEMLLCMLSIIGKTVPVNVSCNIHVPIAQIVFGTLMLSGFAKGLDKTSFQAHWLFCDLIRVVNGSVMLLVTSGQCFVAIASTVPSLLAGEILGLCAGGLFAYDTFLVFSMIKSTPAHP
ncbi:proteolipid protein 2-like [Engraulis encrasicolus]|uniref:proteolipid protein 2-like n=1 Tax=Engraulis encrasicolus TaxID=184585 RepID=UPI002FD176FB